MNLFFSILLFLLALVFVIKGGDFLVDSSLWIAKITRIPAMIIGATIVSVATTLPEVLVSTIAVIKGPEAYGIAVGNAAGSMICNIALILGISAFFASSIVEKRSFNEKAVILAIATTFVIVFSVTGGGLGLIEGIILLFIFVCYLIFNFIDAKKNMKIERTHTQSDYEEAIKHNKLFMIGMLIVGAILIGFGANLLVDNGLYIAKYLGMSVNLMGLTFVAVGTSLPELVTTLKSIKKNQASLGIGNILGANIINSSLLLGICGSIAGIKGSLTMAKTTLYVTFPILVLVTLVLIVPTVIKGKTMKWQGFTLLCIYVLYIVSMVLIEMGAF